MSLLGNPDAEMEAVISQATKFMSACYGITQVNSMTGARAKAWISRTGRKPASKMPKLCSMPSTSEAFKENVKTAHLQCAICRRVLLQHGDAGHTEYGWERNEEKKSHQPVTIPGSQQPAPGNLFFLYCRKKEHAILGPVNVSRLILLVRCTVSVQEILSAPLNKQCKRQLIILMRNILMTKNVMKNPVVEPSVICFKAEFLDNLY